MIEKWGKPVIEKLPGFIRRFYVLLVVCLGFVLFNAVDFTQALSDIKGLFGMLNIPMVTKETLYYLRSYGMLFIVGFVGATPLMKKLGSKLEKTTVGAILEPVLLIALLLVCTAYLVDGSFSPFLYFRF